MATVPQTPSLDLTTITNGIPIKIDGQPYDIRHAESLPLATYRQLEMQSSRLGHLMVKAKLTKEEAAETSQLLAEVTDAILDAPEDVRAKLKDVQRVKIVDLFTKRSETPATTTAPVARRRTGGKSSRR